MLIIIFMIIIILNRVCLGESNYMKFQKLFLSKLPKSLNFSTLTGVA